MLEAPPEPHLSGGLASPSGLPGRGNVPPRYTPNASKRRRGHLQAPLGNLSSLGGCKIHHPSKGDRTPSAHKMSSPQN